MPVIENSNPYVKVLTMGNKTKLPISDRLHANKPVVITVQQDTQLSVGHVSKLIGVSPRLVCKWFDNRIIPGHRLPGDSRERRFYLDDILKFMRLNGFRVDPRLNESSDIISYGLTHDIKDVRQFNDGIEFGIYLATSKKCYGIILGDEFGSTILNSIFDRIKEYQPNAITSVVFHESSGLLYDSFNFSDLKYILPFDIMEIYKVMKDIRSFDAKTGK